MPDRIPPVPDMPQPPRDRLSEILAEITGRPVDPEDCDFVDLDDVIRVLLDGHQSEIRSLCEEIAAEDGDVAGGGCGDCEGRSYCRCRGW